jgi:hypothetical protein
MFSDVVRIEMYCVQTWGKAFRKSGFARPRQSHYQNLFHFGFPD